MNKWFLCILFIWNIFWFRKWRMSLASTSNSKLEQTCLAAPLLYFPGRDLMAIFLATLSQAWLPCTVNPHYLCLHCSLPKFNHWVSNFGTGSLCSFLSRWRNFKERVWKWPRCSIDWQCIVQHPASVWVVWNLYKLPLLVIMNCKSALQD